MRALILPIIMLFVNNISVANSEIKLMPEELVIFAKKNGCDQVDDFYNRPGRLNPPYVYDYPNEDSAAFWCQAKEGDKRRFFLLIMVKYRVHELRKCQSKIEWTNTYPGGLSLIRDRESTLDEFIYLKNPKKKGPKDVKLTDNAILSEYDGVGVTFYCHRREWLVRQTH